MAWQRVYYERGQPIEVITWWARLGPRNVLIERGDGTQVVRPFSQLVQRICPSRPSPLPWPSCSTFS